jgi:phosphoribosylamine--glycine ligase
MPHPFARGTLRAICPQITNGLDRPPHKAIAMKVLLIGSGGREHALAWKLAASPKLTKLYAAPGNPGIAECAECVALDPADHGVVTAFCRKAGINLVVIGPEAPLVAGLADDLAKAGIKVFGPSRAAAQLEGSKTFTKEVADEAGIPTAAWARFTDAASARAHVDATGAPIVIKADGLAAGKGVTVAASVEEAKAAIDDCFGGKFGASGSSVVIEECLVGTEASFFVVSDGRTSLPLGSAQDHKRAFDGDTGPNTGGMGVFSPSPLVDEAMTGRIMREIATPAIETMRRRGTPFTGVLFVGLMMTATGPKLIEFNVRFGDPECEALMMRLDGDLLEVLLATAEGRLEGIAPRWSGDAAVCVIMAARGYPDEPQKGTVISGLDAAARVPGVKLFHAGTALKDGRLVANGGRVLAVTARAASIEAARDAAYEAVDRIDWPGGFCRRDIAAKVPGR